MCIHIECYIHHMFQCTDGDSEKCHLWTAVDLLIFLAMGFVGGLLGALFNSLNKTLTRHRLRWLFRRGKHVKLVSLFYKPNKTFKFLFLLHICSIL